jgi:hypothetical protein
VARLANVGRAMTVAQDAYAAALAERDELRGRVQAYAAKAAAVSPSAVGAADDLADLARRATDLLDDTPADLVRARAMVAAYQAYLATLPPPARPASGGTP